MSDVRILPAVEDRVETGPVQFGEDWPGVFIRGDDAAYLVMVLNQFLNGPVTSRDVFAESALRGLAQTLAGCIVSAWKPPSGDSSGA